MGLEVRVKAEVDVVPWASPLWQSLVSPFPAEHDAGAECEEGGQSTLHKLDRWLSWIALTK